MLHFEPGWALNYRKLMWLLPVVYPDPSYPVIICKKPKPTFLTIGHIFHTKTVDGYRGFEADAKLFPNSISGYCTFGERSVHTKIYVNMIKITGKFCSSAARDRLFVEKLMCYIEDAVTIHAIGHHYATERDALVAAMCNPEDGHVRILSDKEITDLAPTSELKALHYFLQLMSYDMDTHAQLVDTVRYVFSAEPVLKHNDEAVPPVHKLNCAHDTLSEVPGALLYSDKDIPQNPLRKEWDQRSGSEVVLPAAIRHFFPREERHYAIMDYEKFETRLRVHKIHLGVSIDRKKLNKLFYNYDNIESRYIPTIMSKVCAHYWLNEDEVTELDLWDRVSPESRRALLEKKKAPEVTENRETRIYRIDHDADVYRWDLPYVCFKINQKGVIDITGATDDLCEYAFLQIAQIILKNL